MKIAIKFAIVAFAACLLPTGAYVLFAREAQGEITERARASFQESTNEFGQRLDDWYFTNQAALRTMARIPDLMTMDRAAGRAELKAFTDAMPWSRVVFASDTAGEQVLRTDDDKPINISARPYYKDALEKRLGRLVSVSPVTGASSFYIVVPLARETGGAGGLIGLGIDLDKVSKSIASMDKDDPLGRRVFIVDEEAKLLAHSDPAAVAQPRKGELAAASKHPLWERRPRAGQMAIANYADESGKRWIGAMRQSSLGWYVAVEAPAEKFAAEPRAAARDAWLCALGASLACALLAGLAGSAFALRPRALARAARDRAAGRDPEPAAARDWGPYHDAARLVGLAEGERSESSGRGRLALLCSLAVALPALAGVGLFLQLERERSEAAALRDARELLVGSARRSSQKLLSWMEANRVGLTAMASMPGYWERMGSDKEEDKAWAKGRLKLAIVQLPWVRASFTIDPLGMMTLRSDNTKLVDVKDRLYFQQGRDGKFGHQIVISRNVVTQPTPVLDITKPITAADGKLLGVAAFAIDVDSASRQIAHEKVGREGIKFVLDADGGVLGHPDPDKMAIREGKLANFSSHPLWAARPAGAAPVLLDFEQDGQRHLGAIAKTGNFYVGAAIARAEIMERSEPGAADAVAWLLAACAVALTLGGALGLLVAQGAERASRAAGRALRSEPAEQEAPCASDENGDLSRALRDLTRSGMGSRPSAS